MKLAYCKCVLLCYISELLLEIIHNIYIHWIICYISCEIDIDIIIYWQWIYVCYKVLRSSFSTTSLFCVMIIRYGAALRSQETIKLLQTVPSENGPSGISVDCGSPGRDIKNSLTTNSNKTNHPWNPDISHFL